MICYSLGIVATFLLAAIVNWRIVMAIMAAWCGVLFICQLVILPESHIWLMEKGKKDEADSQNQNYQ